MHTFKINRTKSEAPLMAVFAGFALVISLVFYPRILWLSFLAFPILALAYMLLKKLELGLFRRKCFLVADEEGIRYCFHLFQQPRVLLWNQVEKVNYQMYEINLRLKESGQVISLQTSYLENPSEFPMLRELINAKCEQV
jgi:hypothetical protein